MAIIQTIRDKYAKVAGAVIVLALVGFVLMDFGKGGFSGSTTAAKVNGEKIDFIDYQNEINARDEQMRAQNPQYSPTEEQNAQMREQVWTQMVSDALLSNIFDKLGITVSDRELQDMFTGPVPNPQVVQFVQQQTASFNAQVAGDVFKQLQNAKDPETLKFWNAFKKELIDSRKEEKISNIVSGAVYTPKAMLDMQFTQKNTYANINFVQIPYTSVSDDKVKVSDDEIKKYMEARKSIFTYKTDSRNLEYVAFPMTASATDSVAINSLMDSVKPGFINTDDAEGYASLYSTQPTAAQPATMQTLQQFPNAAEIVNAPVGSVVGPFAFGDMTVMAKLTSKEPDSGAVAVRHLLVMTKQGGNPMRNEEDGQRLIDSLAKAANSGANFDSLAANYSDDGGSKNNGGKYTFQAAQRESLSKEFGDFAFTGKVGERKIVRVDNQSYTGYHYIEILPNNAEKQVVFLAKRYEPSEATKQDLNSKATKFATDAAKGGNAFDKAAQAMGLQKMPLDNVNPNSSLLGNLGASNDMVKWATDAKIGNLSPIYIVNNSYVIAKLTGIAKKGELNMSAQAKEYVTNELKRQKKAAIIMKDYASITDINAAATKSGQTVNSQDSVSLAIPRNPMLNMEQKVVGYTFSNALKVGTTSKPIAGMQGVYLVNLVSKIDNSKGQERNIAIEENLSSAMYKTNAFRSFMGSMTNNADIDDKRQKYMQSAQ